MTQSHIAPPNLIAQLKQLLGKYFFYAIIQRLENNKHDKQGEQSLFIIFCAIIGSKTHYPVVLSRG